MHAKDVIGGEEGRWPANLMHDGSEEVVAMFPDAEGQQASARNDNSDSGNKVYGKLKNVTTNPEPRVEENKSAARFFKVCKFDEIDLLFCKAKTILESWNYDLVDTAEPNLNLSEVLVYSVLNDVVILASRGEQQLIKETQSHFMNVTLSELSRLSMTLITTILSLEKKFWQEQPHEKCFPNGCHVNVVATQKQIGTMTIIINHWRLNGSAEDVTLNITSQLSEHGGKVLGNRLIYVPKTSRADRNEGCNHLVKKPLLWSSGTKNPGSFQSDNTDRSSSNNHPTVKPTELMQYLVRMVTRKNGLCLDHMCGSGSTIKACAIEGIDAVGIDEDPHNIEIARLRTQYIIDHYDLFGTYIKPK